MLDFGVARHAEPGASGTPITRAGQIVGTPSYMAPEQIHGSAIGPEADLYALGLVMAEAASGVRVYDQGSAMEILDAADVGRAGALAAHRRLVRARAGDRARDPEGRERALPVRRGHAR